MKKFGLLLMAVSSCAQAGMTLDLGFALGQEDQHTYSIGAGADVGRDWRLDARHAITRGSQELTDSALAASWQTNAWLVLEAGYARTLDDALETRGPDASVSLVLDQLASWTAQSTLRVEYSRREYLPAVNNAPPALVAMLPEQNRYGLHLTQGIGENLLLDAGYDIYDYTQDPLALAILLIKLRRPMPGAAYLMSTFPDRGWNVGASWQASPNLALGARYARTESVAGQRFSDVRLDWTYRFKDSDLTVGVTRSAAGKLVSPGGITIVDDSSGYYLDMGWSLRFE